MPDKQPTVRFKGKKLSTLVNDNEATAKAVKLVYVNNQQAGINRIKSGKSFKYVYGNKVVKDKKQIARIRSLVIPPAWEDVWICSLENGHLQATGIDVKKRKQYKYHALWNELRNHTKFYRMLEFGKILPSVRKKLDADISLSGLPKNKVLALVISLMEKTSIRVGSSFYEKLYGSFGMTTLKDQHVKIKGASIHFMFKGKKGVEHQVSLKNKKLAKIVQHCRDIPGKELFQYIDENNERQMIDSGMVNEYIRELTGSEFTAKDFRTWTGTTVALQAFSEGGIFEDEKDGKKKVVEALDKVSAHLGNTRTVCRKYYVHPVILEMYEKGELQDYLDKIKSAGEEEKVLIEILEKLH